MLIEGESDAPVVREVLKRKHALRENEHFYVHPHQGKGKRPANPLSRPDPRRRGLLDQLPAKLRGFSREAEAYDVRVLTLLDSDDEDCRELKAYLLSLEPCPSRAVFRIAVEETESWFLADPEAVRAAFPRARRARFPSGPPDQVIGAWETLARVLGESPTEITGRDKLKWAEAIAPHLDFDSPKSPSLRAFLGGIERLLQ